MKLVKMTQEEYDRWAPRSQAAYAQDKERANRLTRTEAEKIAAADFTRLLPDALWTPGNFLYSIYDGEVRVGSIWFMIRGSEENKKAWVCDVIIEDEFRGRGFGKAAMTLIENEVRSLGLREIGLHVFGFNTVAYGLYQSLGYETTDLVMAKVLS